MEVAIIGLGSWGLSALERLVTWARQEGPALRPATVHVVEPNPAGSGVHAADQPSYLLLNNPCGQLSLWTDEDSPDQPRYRVGLFEYAKRRGYRWDGDHWTLSGIGREVTRHDYLPRCVMGEYLEWFYRTLVEEAPAALTIVHHRCQAEDILPRVDSREDVYLADGTTLSVDHVIMTVGHTPNVATLGGDGGVGMPPYPVQSYVETLPSDCTVGVAGMGLVAIDVVVGLTVGRGGRFVEDGNRMRYVASGREPAIHLFSRSGLPYCAKAVSGVNDTGSYRPVICTPEAMVQIRGGVEGAVDLRADVMPLAFAEMQLRYLSQSARLADGEAAGAEVRQLLSRAWLAEEFELRVESLAARYGRFDPHEHFFGNPGGHYAASKDYQTDLYDHIASDLDASLMAGGSSPIKHAYEVWRINRDDLRVVIENRGLSLGSYLDFEHNIRSRINRLIAGPPALRSQQFLALMDAGVLAAPYGPSPLLEPAPGRVAAVRSTAFKQPYREELDVLVHGHLEEPLIQRSATDLLSRLHDAGRIQQLRYGELPVGSVELDAESHPINTAGVTEERLSMFGVITEGTRYFTHYLPSPKSRLRAVQDLGECVGRIFA